MSLLQLSVTSPTPPKNQYELINNTFTIRFSAGCLQDPELRPLTYRSICAHPTLSLDGEKRNYSTKNRQVLKRDKTLEKKLKKWRNDESLGRTKAIRMMVGAAVVVQH